MYICPMQITIFKSEAKAKVYQIFSVKNQGVYKKDELVRIVKTDNIKELMGDLNYECRAVEKTIG